MEFPMTFGAWKLRCPPRHDWPGEPRRTLGAWRLRDPAMRRVGAQRGTIWGHGALISMGKMPFPFFGSGSVNGRLMRTWLGFLLMANMAYIRIRHGIEMEIPHLLAVNFHGFSWKILWMFIGTYWSSLLYNLHFKMAHYNYGDVPFIVDLPINIMETDDGCGPWMAVTGMRFCFFIG